MNAHHIQIESDAPGHDRRVSQLRYLSHFLDVFASGDPVMRVAAAHYCERLREEGCDTEEMVRMAATALLVAIEREFDEKTPAPAWMSGILTRGPMPRLEDRHGGTEHHDRAA